VAGTEQPAELRAENDADALTCVYHGGPASGSPACRGSAAIRSARSPAQTVLKNCWLTTVLGNVPKRWTATRSTCRSAWLDGCIKAEQLHQEINVVGYRGGDPAPCQYVRARCPSIPATSAAPGAVRPAGRWLDPAQPRACDLDEQQKPDALAAICPRLAAVHEHLRGFAAMMLHLHEHKLDLWMETVQTDVLPELPSFVTGVRRDSDAARVGLTMYHSYGKAEGHVNRISMINEPISSSGRLSGPVVLQDSDGLDEVAGFAGAAAQLPQDPP
jgi:hypothetical protein